MVDIIKLEDLTLDEVKSRIKSLDPAFTENNLFFTALLQLSHQITLARLMCLSRHSSSILLQDIFIHYLAERSRQS